MTKSIECIGGFADGRRFDGFPEAEMILYHAKDGVHTEQKYVEHEGNWWYWPLFNRLIIMNYYDWSINDEQ